jgi:hypothetical protein
MWIPRDRDNAMLIDCCGGLTARKSAQGKEGHGRY